MPDRAPFDARRMFEPRHIWMLAIATCILLTSPIRAEEIVSPVVSAFVSDMHCQHCAKKIRSQIYTVKGVLKVTTNLKKGVVIIVPVKDATLSVKKLWEAIEEVKFTPTKIVSPKGTFEKKPVS